MKMKEKSLLVKFFKFSHNRTPKDVCDLASGTFGMLFVIATFLMIVTFCSWIAGLSFVSYIQDTKWDPKLVDQLLVSTPIWNIFLVMMLGAALISLSTLILVYSIKTPIELLEKLAEKLKAKYCAKIEIEE